MKYRRLSTEELQLLEKEFIQFLAANSITADDWEQLKQDKPELVEKLIGIFSDSVLDQVLSKVVFIETFSKEEVCLFCYGSESVSQIIIKSTPAGPDIGCMAELKTALSDVKLKEKVNVYRAKKHYSQNRKDEVFEKLQSGGVPSKGELYNYFDRLIEAEV